MYPFTLFLPFIFDYVLPKNSVMHNGYYLIGILDQKAALLGHNDVPLNVTKTGILKVPCLLSL